LCRDAWQMRHLCRKFRSPWTSGIKPAPQLVELVSGNGRELNAGAAAFTPDHIPGCMNVVLGLGKLEIDEYLDTLGKNLTSIETQPRLADVLKDGVLDRPAREVLLISSRRMDADRASKIGAFLQENLAIHALQSSGHRVDGQRLIECVARPAA